MDPNKTLEPDRRWAIWKCNSHEEYLAKFFIKGKFSPEVPDVIRTSYEIVERLISYSYFHFPMIEEAVSKMTRIFEMAVRLRADALGIKCNKLYDYLNKLKEQTEVDPDVEIEWYRLREMRNYYAHQDSQSYSGPAPLMLIYPMLNTVNRLFYPQSLFEDCYKNTAILTNDFQNFKNGIFILEMDKLKRLVTCAQPYFISPSRGKTLWKLTPVGISFPQTLDEYFDFNPIILRLEELHIEHEIIIGIDSISQSKVKIYSTEIECNIAAAEKFKQSQVTAEEIVMSLHTHNTKYHRYLEKQKFIYDEFWE